MDTRRHPGGKFETALRTLCEPVFERQRRTFLSATCRDAIPYRGQFDAGATAAGPATKTLLNIEGLGRSFIHN